MIPWIIVVIFIIFYWKCVYYPHHTSDITPISLFLLGVFLYTASILSIFTGNMTIQTIVTYIIPTYAVLAAFMVVSYSLIIIGMKDNKNHINKHIDISVTYVKKLGLGSFTHIFMAISIPLAIFLVIGSYVVFGPDHVYVWAILFIGWIASNARLVNYIEKIRK